MSDVHTVYVVFSDGSVDSVELNVIKYHTVIWMAGEETSSEIGRTEVLHGSVPSLGYTPTKPSDAQYDYVFSGWALAANAVKPQKVNAVDADAVYYAVWRTVERSYTVTWVLTNASGNSVTVNESYKYGKMPEY